MAYNGGYPEKPVFTDKSGNAYIVGWFIPVCGEKKRSVENMLSLLKEDEAIPNVLLQKEDFLSKRRYAVCGGQGEQ